MSFVEVVIIAFLTGYTYNIDCNMINNCKMVNLATFSEVSGSLTFIEGNTHIPFSIERIYYLYDIPDNVERGVHAHKKLEQLIFAVSGSFDITLDDGNDRKVYHMDNPAEGLYICPMVWREINNFSSGAVLMVLASTKYEPEDYIHDYDEFIEYKRSLK